MRFRLIAPQVALAAAGTLALLAGFGAGWPLALAGGAAAGAAAGVAAAFAVAPLLRRIEALGASLRVAARGSPLRPALVAGEDELETAGRTFAELAGNWGDLAGQLSREAATLTAVLDGMAEGIWVTARDGTIVRHNAALARMLPPGQPLLGQSPLSVVRSTALGDAVSAACQRGESAQLEVRLEVGRPRLLSVQVLPLGQPLEGSAAVFHDVTELRRLEKVRQDFVANVSHELRTPITAIRGYAETLQSGALGDAAHAPRMVEVIHRQSEHLSALVADLLELSRIESGELKLERVPVSLAEAVARAAEGVRPRAEQKRLALRTAIPEDALALADRRALEQVLVNLLDNAVKYTPPGGEVEVTCERQGRQVGVVVRDTGIGIDPVHQVRIFERFYRVDKGRSRETGGTGLGLAIVKHLTGAMGGEVRVSSQPGVGSRFSVLLPTPM